VIPEQKHILLGMKKRGFGAGKWNGFGGKVHDGESIDDAARREVQEECCLIVHAMHEVGILDFTFEGKEDEILEVHVYRVDAFTGLAMESEEMKPQWFALDAIPYDDMWPDDRFWLPVLLEGKTFSGAFHFAPDGSIVHQIVTVKE
jgi:8-oxo-dGTP diphosphatase/2-hydroxy-dATP diphosphatase